MARKEAPDTVEVDQVETGTITVYIVGRSPLILNSMPAKARETLLFPDAHRRKTAADRAGRMKHDPLQEFRESVYRDARPDAPTRLTLPAPAFKAAIGTAALRTPGSTKTEVGQLTWVEGRSVPLWGVPEMLMATVRMADISKTPDIRTRAMLQEWCSQIVISFVEPNISSKTIARLMVTAGLICGVGDWRQEKLKGNHGQWRVVPGPSDPDFRRIKKAGGAEQQDAALAEPLFADEDTERLFRWFEEARDRIRGGLSFDDDDDATTDESTDYELTAEEQAEEDATDGKVALRRLADERAALKKAAADKARQKRESKNGAVA